MSTGKNLVTLIGNVGQNPAISHTVKGKKFASFSLGTTERWKDKNTGETKEITDWHKIKIFNGLVGLVENHIKKGNKLYIQGKLKTRESENKQGNKIFVTEIFPEEKPIGTEVTIV